MKRKRDSAPVPADQDVQEPSKRRKPAAYVNTEAQQQSQARASAAVQTEADIDEAADTPSQQDPNYPVTPPPRKKGRPRKQAM